MVELRQPFDEAKLTMIRNFLRERFPAHQLRESFDFENTAQRFALEHGSHNRHSLIVPKETFDDVDLFFLLNQGLVDALNLAGAIPVTLTTKGPRY